MTLKEIFDNLSINHSFWAILVLTLVQIAPIKINPWTALLKWIDKIINEEIYKKIDSIKDEVGGLKRDFENTKSKDMRWNILDFANSCRNGRLHDKEEWEHVIDQLREYEEYIEEKNLTNGVIEEDAKYLRELYRERCKQNDFL